MPIIPGKFCEQCAETKAEPVPAEYELDSCGVDSGGGGFVCDGCYTNAAEAAYERMVERYYGSDQPQTINERYQAAAKVKREERH